MKNIERIFLVTVILASVGSICLAQDPAAQHKAAGTTSASAETTKKITGKVSSVTLADPAKGVKSEIVIVDEAGKSTTILVKSTTTIYDANMQAITLDKVIKDQEVKVKYSTTKDGVDEASSIHLVK